MVVLYLVPKRTYDVKMSRVRFDQMAAIGKLSDVRIWGPGWDKWDDAISPADNVRRVSEVAHVPPPHVVVTYQVKDLARREGGYELGVPVVTQFNEAFDHPKVEEFVRSAGCRLVFFHHENDVPAYVHWNNLGIHRVHLPHAVNASVYKDYGQPKDIDVLVVGNLNNYYYPFRYRLMGIARTLLAKRGYRVEVLKHPGYELPAREGTYVREDFSQMINRSKVVMTCSMRYNYALAKYSEIAASRSLAVADIPAERQEFFRQTVLEVSPHQTDGEILTAIEAVLDDPAELQRRTQTAYGMTLDHCTMERYAEGFIHTVKALLKGTL